MASVSASFAAVPALAPGAHVRVVAPASPFSREDFEVGVRRLRARYEVSFDEAIFERDGYLAGDDARRLDELRRALTDDDVDGVVAARGGYGVTRLLDRISVADVRPRLLVGFSDLSALRWAQTMAARPSGNGTSSCQAVWCRRGSRNPTASGG